MSRKITREAVNAFMAGKDFKSGNTVVFVGKSSGRVSMELHGKPIALRAKDPVTGAESLEVSMAGWNTVTTRERLNGIPGVSMYCRDFQPHLNGNKINMYDWYAIEQK